MKCKECKVDKGHRINCSIQKAIYQRKSVEALEQIAESLKNIEEIMWEKHKGIEINET